MLPKLYLEYAFILLSLSLSLAKNSRIINPCRAGGYQGDVALSDEDLRIIRSNTRSKRAVTNEQERKWPHGIIPYEISDDYDGNEKAVIQSAIRHWEMNTCISFIERESQSDYAVFQDDGDCGCCSYVGRMGQGQAQGVNLAKNCIRNGTIAHEIGHLIGFWHEHTRPDRDRYVEILRRNVLNGEMKNFRKLGRSEVNSFNVPYDFESIMHYAKHTFSKNGFEVTIRPIPGLYAKEIGQRLKLSPLDIKQANLLYDCPSCGRTFTESRGNFSLLTSEMKILRPHTCSWRILWTAGERLKLKINYIFFKFRCKRAYLEIRDGKHKKSPLRGRYCKGNPPPKEIMTSSSKSLFLTFHYGYRYYYDGRPVGFKAEYEITCGGPIHAKEGIIRSPNYPENYKGNQQCDWEIVVPKGGRVAVKFVMFQLEESDNCEYDYVELTDGVSNKKLRRLCDVKLPKQYIMSESNKMKIRFKSDGNVHLGGFSMKFLTEIDECTTGSHNCSQGCRDTIGDYECYCSNGQQLHSNGRECEKACGKIYNSFHTSGVITSPSYPSNYPINRQCTWEIKARKGFKIIFDILDFDLEDNEDNKVCNPNYDYLEIKAGKFQERICDVVDTPKRITSESNYMRINFNSDNTVSARGFKAKFSHIKDHCAINNGGCSQNCTNTARSPVCSCNYGYTLKADMRTCIEGACNKKINSTTGKGLISSPDYPKLYHSNKPCKWNVFTTPGQRFDITIKDIKCDMRTSSMIIWWKQFGKKRTIKRLCNVRDPNEIHTLTDGNIFNVEFLSGSFSLAYSSTCGGKIAATRTPKKFYSHLKFGKENYPPNQNCKWLLYAKNKQGKKRKLQLRFTNFKLEGEASSCNYDYIKVYDNDRVNENKLLSTDCGHMKQRVYESTGAYLLVVFKSDKSIGDIGFEAEVSKPRMRRKRHHIRLYDPFNDAATSSRTRDFYF
eukprot:gene7308-8125_t